MKYLLNIARMTFLFSCFISPFSYALEISNGSLVVNVREDNGAVDSYILNGIDFFELGSHISDWGMQVDTDTSSFEINTTYGSDGIPVVVTQISSNSVEVKGLYTSGGANVEVVRTLSVLSNFDALVFSYRLTNLDAFDPITVNIFETFDPDQGQTTGHGFGTYNDVFIQDGFKVGQAVDETGLAFMIASNDPRVIMASGNPFNIGNGSALNNVIANPYDGEGGFADLGTHMVLVATLEANEVTESIAAGGVVEANGPMEIVGQPVDAAVISVIETTIGEGVLIDSGVSVSDILASEDTGGTIITRTETTEDEGTGATSLLIIIFSLIALFRKKKLRVIS
jgi:hypothetical protein